MDQENQPAYVTSLFDAIEDAIVAFNNDFCYTYVNDTALALIDKTREEILGKKLMDVFPGLLQKSYGRLLRVAQDTGTSQEWEYFSPRAKRWLEVHAYKTPYGVVAFYTDVSFKHSLQESLKEKIHLLDLSNDAIQMQDATNKIFYWNKGAERIYGWKAEEIIGKCGYKLFQTQFPGGYKSFFSKLRKKKQWKGLLTHTTKSKKIIVVESSWSMLEKNGEIQILEINRDITSSELYKRQTEVNEKRFRTIIENSEDAIIITNADLQFLYISPSIKNVLGYTPEECRKLDMRKIIFPEDYPNVIKLYKQVIRKKKTEDGVFRVKNKKGEWRWINIHQENLLDEPVIQGVVSTFRDITERRMYTQKLEEQNNKITEILENFNYGYFAINKDWKYTYINKQAVKIAQRTKRSMIGKKIWDLYPETERREAGINMKNVMQKRIPMSFESYYPPSKKWYMHYIYPTVEGIAEYTIDITDKKNFEEQILDTREELDTILKSIPSGVIVEDSAGKIIYANNEGIRLLDYRSVDPPPHSSLSECLYKFDIRDEYNKRFPVENMPGKILVKTGNATQKTLKFINKQTGKSRWITVSANGINKGQEKRTVVVNVFHDVTYLKDADVRKNDFISMASHELKTPLTSLNVYMHLLSEREKKKGIKEDNYISKATEQIERLQQLVAEMLDQSTIQQGKLALHMQEIYIDFFVKEFTENFRQTIKGFTITCKGQTDSIVSIDKFRLEQVLANLLSNAVKYSLDNKQIIISMSKKDSFVWISVKDFGMGIPKSELFNIFKPYYRVIGKKENTFPGMGMGLYITKDIVAKHGGEIVVDSIQGKGTTISFSIPIVVG